MEKEIDFIEIARTVVKEFKDGYDSENHDSLRYVDIQLYVSILEDGNIRTSSKDEVLWNAKECFIILTYEALAISNFYRWYVIKHIDEYGNVHEGFQDREWSIEISFRGSFSNQVMSLYYQRHWIKDDTPLSPIEEKQEFYFVRAGQWKCPWDEPFNRLWQVYKIMRECKSNEERALIAENIELKEEVNFLEEKNNGMKFVNERLTKEKKMYKSLLDEIKKLVDAHK